MQIYNMESRWIYAFGAGVAHIVDVNQPPFDTFAVMCLTKTRGGGSGSGAGGYCGVVQCDGDDLSTGDSPYPPAHFRRQMRTITIGLVSEGQYAQCMITLMRET